MTKAVIAIDLDDVLADESNVIRPYINQRFNKELTEADYQISGAYSGYWERVWGVSKDEGRQIYDEYVASGAKAGLHPVPGAIEAVAYLKLKYDLVIITARRDHLVDVTEAWLNEHFPNIFDHVAFARVWEDGKKVPKAVIASELKAQYLIDDSPEHCILAAEAGINALLFSDYGWSKDVVLPETVARVADWQSVMEYFDAIK